MKPELFQPVLGRESLEEIATVALEFGRLLMETGASARNVEEITGQVAAGLGAERMDARVGYASLSVMLSIGPDWITCMCKVGPLGVNQRLYHALRATAAQIERGGFTVEGLGQNWIACCALHPVTPTGSSPWRSEWRAPPLVGCWMWTGRASDRSSPRRLSVNSFATGWPRTRSMCSSPPRWSRFWHPRCADSEHGGPEARRWPGT
jgi:hypothetical protein